MKNKLNTLLVILSTATLLTGCGKDKNKDKNKKVFITAESKMEAETLALAGEQLVGPYTFMLADKIFDMSLKNDPENPRANLYKAFIKPFLTNKGILTRIVPLVNKYGKPEEIEKYNKDIKNIPNSPARDFLLDGSTDIVTVEDYQKQLASTRDAWNDFRKYLKMHNDFDLTLNLNPHVWKSVIEKRLYDTCKVVSEVEGKEMNVECDYTSIAQVKMNIADIKVLEQFAASMVLSTTFYTSYSLEGAMEWAKDVQQRREKGDVEPTKQEAHAYFMNHHRFGTLLDYNSMRTVVEIGSDLVAATKFAMSYQNAHCNDQTPKIRKGYIFEELDVCGGKAETPDNKHTLASFLSQIEQGLAGPVTIDYLDENEVNHQTKIDYLALFKNPVSNLQQIAPLKVDNCGHGIEWNDPTLGGMLPLGDASEVFGGNCNSN